MINVTLQIIGGESPHVAYAGKHLESDIVAVYPIISASPSPNSRLVFIHINGVPTGNISSLIFLAHGDDQHRHIWHFDKTGASEQGLLALQAHRQISIDWARAKQLIRNKITGQYLTDQDIT